MMDADHDDDNDDKGDIDGPRVEASVTIARTPGKFFSCF
jgi:hypothetical protein